jgi:dolichol-phosphate mannosyltransferase
MKPLRIAAVIPCFRVRGQILGVLARIGPEVHAIYIVDDRCPEESGETVRREVTDPRVTVLFNEANLGVGGATIRGFKQAVEDGADIVVKLDGDGQMDPSLIPKFVTPIVRGHADYTKGNRFFNMEDTALMPTLRFFGNAVLSFMAKLSTGYWGIFDPTNGYVAIHCKVAKLLPMEKMDRRYFFETDLLFRLNTLRALVVDIPMVAIYGGERSNLRVGKEVLRFLVGHARNAAKRVYYTYFLRDFNVASIELVLGAMLAISGSLFGVAQWLKSGAIHEPATAGTVMLAALPIMLGVQLLLGFINYDVSHSPRECLHIKL